MDTKPLHDFMKSEASKLISSVNDQTTRNNYAKVVFDFLVENHGSENFRVICDEYNNPADVVDKNEFVCEVWFTNKKLILRLTPDAVVTVTETEMEDK